MTPKRKLDLTIYKNKNINSTRQFEEFTKNITSKIIDNSPSISTNECLKEGSIASLKNSLKMNIKNVYCDSQLRDKNHMVNDLKITLFNSKVPEFKNNPPITNTARSRHRIKSQIFVVEQPELTDRSREANKELQINFNNHKKAASLDIGIQIYGQSSNFNQNLENDSLLNIISQNKLNNINESKSFNKFRYHFNRK